LEERGKERGLRSIRRKLENCSRSGYSRCKGQKRIQNRKVLCRKGRKKKTNAGKGGTEGNKQNTSTSLKLDADAGDPREYDYVRVIRSKKKVL